MKWLARMRRWKFIVVGCVLGLLCGLIFRGGSGYVGELYLRWFPTDNLLKCVSERFSQPCLTPSQLRMALLHAEPLRTQLHTKAGQFECGVKTVHTRGITIEELRKALPKGNVDDGDVVTNILHLILYNPHWDIVWLDSDGNKVSDWIRHARYSDQLQSTSPYYSISCRISIFFFKLWSIFKIVFLVVVAAIVVVGVVKWWLLKRRRAERNKFIMIDKILSVLRRHYETAKLKNNLLPYLAIIHVRDMLISPSERDYKLDTWDKACSWIAKYESRVRVEQQRIAGEDFDVWKWIQEDPPNTEETIFLNKKEEVTIRGSSVQGHGTSPSVSPPSSTRKKNWQKGTTFDDDIGRNTGRNSRINSPYGTPSPCIRLKNMFEAIKHMKDEQSREIEDSVLDRCSSHGNVVHIYVDRRSPFGCVYLKMDDVESAVKAYKALHGGWYKGKLVTAKYIPLEKYFKWFPAATSAKKHLYPSS